MPDYQRVIIENRPSVDVHHSQMLDVHLRGGRLYVIAFAACLSLVALYGIADGIYMNNQLKQRELDIREKQLELEQRRFSLDSIRYYGGGKIKQK